MISFLNLMNKPEYAHQFFSFAAQFPALAYTLYQYILSFGTHVQQLSPRARANLHKFSLMMYTSIVWMFKKGYKVYQSLMSFPKRQITDWKSPSGIILRPLARMILFIFPVETQQSLKLVKDQPIVFVSNRSVYSLDSVPLVCAIYHQSGAWPRVSVDAYHFSIPIWKHLIEYFGAYPHSSPSVTAKILESGHSVILYPGGIRESTKVKDAPLYPIHSWSLDFLSQLNEYQVVPVSSVGFNDMFEHIYDLDISPALWIAGYKDQKQTLPLLYPRSYERSYLSFGTPGTYTEAQTFDQVSQGIKELRVVQSLDSRRHLMTKVGRVLQRGNKWIVYQLKSIHTKKWAAQSGRYIYSWIVYALEKI